MREIKFRAWQSHNYGKGEWRWSMVYQDIYGLDEYFGLLRSGSDYKLMQYTGLKDKKGVEIYEGDIVEQSYCDGAIHGRVEYSDIESGFITLGLKDFKDYPICFNKFYANKSLVIGNIYQNPELLEASND